MVRVLRWESQELEALASLITVRAFLFFSLCSRVARNFGPHNSRSSVRVVMPYARIWGSPANGGSVTHLPRVPLLSRDTDKEHEIRASASARY